MRVLLVNHFPLQGSGSGVYVLNIARSLEKAGHKTCIITPENTTDYLNVKDVKLHPVFFKFKEEIEGQQDFNFACFDPHPRSSLLFSDMTENQIAQYEEAFRKAIKEEIEEFKPDIIHAQHIWLISKVALEFNLPVVVTSHGSDIMGFQVWPKFHGIMHEVADNCRKIIAISNHSKEVISNIFSKDAQKVITISNGYDEKIFYKEQYNKEEVLRELNINKNYDKIVCFSGRLTKNKGIDLLLKAAKTYEDGNTLTLIAGFGQEYEYLNNLKEELELKDVVFLGNRNYETLRKIYNISDVCAVPSRQEAFGLVALESLACGTPVVAAKEGGIPDFVNDKVGILIQGENISELEKGIMQIINKEKTFDSEYLAKYARENYRQDLFIDKLVNIYKENLN